MKRKTLERTLFYALLIIFLIGCKDLNHDLLGDYIIEEASIDSISVLRTELIQINSLFLSIDGDCTLPNAYKKNYSPNKWQFKKEKGKYLIIFSHASPFFNDIFQIDSISKHKVKLINKHKILVLSR